MMKKHDHKNCRHLLHSLSEFIDGSLAENLCSEIERHLEDCPDCNVVVDSLRKTVYLYRTSSEPADVPAEVKERLFQKLNLDDFLEK
jgi:anti-sigma factor (TIGR02949 family)